MAKVIDALVVTLGLDPSGYKKGAADAKAAQDGLKQSAQQEAKVAQGAAEAGGKSAQKLGAEKRKQDTEERKRQRERERAARNQQAEEKKHTDASIDRLKSLGLAAAGAVIGFNTIKGAIEGYFNATNQLANLGRVAPTIGVDVKALDVLGDAYKQVGGKAEEAGADIAKLAHAQFSFAVNAPDAMAGWMRRLGVSLFDNKGQARDKQAVEEDVARALKAKTKDIQTQAMYAREMGFSESFIQLYLVKQAAERAKILANAEKTAKADKESADAAVKAEQARARLGEHIKGAKQQISSAIAKVEAPVENIISDALDTGNYFGAFGKLVAGYKRRVTANMLAADFKAAEKKNGLPAGFLASVAAKESRFNVDAVSPAGARGIMQLMPQYYPNAGKDPVADINKAGQILGAHYRRHLSEGFDSETAKRMALEDYNAGATKADNVRKGRIDRGTGRPTQFKPETVNYPGEILENTARFNSALAPTADRAGTIDRSSTSNSNASTTHIDQINIHTQATDAPGIAATLPDALRRQGVVAQANTGQR